MSKIKFLENSRVATGGMMSSPILLIEFQGDEDTYHENGYIVKKSKSEWNSDTYYTISNPDGTGFKTLDEFLKTEKKKKSLIITRLFKLAYNYCIPSTLIIVKC